ncbi:MAG: hypothetical protein RI894_615 [Bacteroidota bacterium]|jgi:ABC-2 type transport system permease protein
MKKLRLIIEREYLTRVRKKSFILTTLLAPVGIAVFAAVVSVIFSYQSDALKIIIRDDAALLANQMPNNDDKGLSFEFDNTKTPIDSLVKHKNGFDGVLFIPKLDSLNNIRGIAYYSEKPLGLLTQELIERQLTHCIRDKKIADAGYDKAILKSLETNIRIEQRTTEKSEDKSAKQLIATAVGGIMGFLIYIILIVYGTMVMRSVSEEKTSRIVEVMISSVKPFQLMLGKIIAVGLVGLTQLAVWGILSVLSQMAIAMIFHIDASKMPMQGGQAEAAKAMQGNMGGLDINALLHNLSDQNWWLILPLFVFYFLGGYFLYASLFAAVGASVGDDASDSQALTFPITIPVVLAIYIMFAVIQNPNSSLARWSSQIPLFSPIVMPARLPFGPEWWEIALSVTILATTAIGTVWLSGRIYRVGILLYGKKASLKEIATWIFRSE